MRARRYSLMTDAQYMKWHFDVFPRQRCNHWTKRVCMRRSRDGESGTPGKTLEPSLIEVRCPVGSQLYSEFGFPKKRSQRCQSARSVLQTRKEEGQILFDIRRLVRGRLLFSRPVEGVPLFAINYAESDLRRSSGKREEEIPSSQKFRIENKTRESAAITDSVKWSSDAPILGPVSGLYRPPCLTCIV